MLLMIQLLLNRYFVLSVQLQVISLVMVLELVILWLCELIIAFVFGSYFVELFVVENDYLRKTGKVFQLFATTFSLYVDWTIWKSFSDF